MNSRMRNCLVWSAAIALSPPSSSSSAAAAASALALAALSLSSLAASERRGVDAHG